MPVSTPPEKKTDTFEHPLKRRVKRQGTYTREQVAIGALGTLLAHIWLFYMLSLGLLKTEPIKTEDRYKEFSIELSNPEKEEEEQFYTQTNPDVPENEPDDTNRYAARDQQAANEEKPEELDPNERPALESDDIVKTDNVISGEFADRQEKIEITEESVDDSRKQSEEVSGNSSENSPLLVVRGDAELSQQKEIPLFGSQEPESEDESGIADFDYSKLNEAPTNVTDLIEGSTESESDESVKSLDQVQSPLQLVGQEEADPDRLPSPRPRPTLPRVTKSFTRDSSAGVKTIGTLAVDARGREMGEYSERLFEIVGLYWNDLGVRNSVVVERSVVKIEFTLRKDGMVKDIQIMEGTTARAYAIYMCREAILSAAPFAPWPDGLIDVYGEEKVIGLHFYYGY